MPPELQAENMGLSRCVARREPSRGGESRAFVEGRLVAESVADPRSERSNGPLGLPRGVSDPDPQGCALGYRVDPLRGSPPKAVDPKAQGAALGIGAASPRSQAPKGRYSLAAVAKRKKTRIRISAAQTCPFTTPGQSHFRGQGARLVGSVKHAAKIGTVRR